jgi:hypothetical protein
VDEQQNIVVRIMMPTDSAEEAAPAAEVIKKTIEPHDRMTRHEIER